MAPYRSAFIVAGIACLALLQTTQAQNSTGSSDDPVLDVFFIQDDSLGVAGLGDQQLAGSLISAVSPLPCAYRREADRWYPKQNPTQTVLALECVGNDIDVDICGDHPITVTYGPRTFVYADQVGNVGATVSCSLDGTTSSAKCSATLVAPAQVFTNPLIGSSELNSLITASGVQLSTASVTGTVMPSDMTQYSVTITAGQAALASASAQSTSPAGNSGAKLSPVFSGFFAGIVSLTMMVL